MKNGALVSNLHLYTSDSQSVGNLCDNNAQQKSKCGTSSHCKILKHHIASCWNNVANHLIARLEVWRASLLCCWSLEDGQQRNLMKTQFGSGRQAEITKHSCPCPPGSTTCKKFLQFSKTGVCAVWDLVELDHLLNHGRGRDRLCFGWRQSHIRVWVDRLTLGLPWDGCTIEHENAAWAQVDWWVSGQPAQSAPQRHCVGWHLGGCWTVDRPKFQGLHQITK